MDIFIYIYWGGIFFVFLVIIGYPMFLLCLPLSISKPTQNGTYLPVVSIIIPVYNGEEQINSKLDNLLVQSYPSEKMEIIVASDASSDKTDILVKKYEKRVTLIRLNERGGKEKAVKLAISSAKGDIVILTDISANLDDVAIEKSVSWFKDPTVGCVSSRDVLITNELYNQGDSSYIEYEMWIRERESKIGNVMGMSGSFFAIRKDLCTDWPEDYPGDIFASFTAIRARKRGIFDRNLKSYYSSASSPMQQYWRRVRTTAGGFIAVSNNLDLLNPIRYGLFSTQILFHKLFRWILPFVITAIFIANIVLSKSTMFYALSLTIQLFFGSMAIYGLFFWDDKTIRLPRKFLFCILDCLAVMHAWLYILRGNKFNIWNPTKRVFVNE